MSLISVFNTVFYKLKKGNKDNLNHQGFVKLINKKNKKSIIQYLKESDEITYEIVDFIERFFNYILRFVEPVFKKLKEKDIFYKTFVITSGILSLFFIWFISYVMCL